MTIEARYSRLLVATLLIATVSLAACKDNTATTPTTTTPTSAAGTNTSNLAGPPASIPTPPITFAPENPQARQAVENIREQLAVNEDEKTCVIQKLSADPALAARNNGQPTAEDLTPLVQQCKQQVTFANTFVQAVTATHPELTPQQQDCLRNAYASLTPNDLDNIIAAGDQPASPKGQTGARTLQDLLTRCGVPTSR